MRPLSTALALTLFAIGLPACNADTINNYLFVGHPRGAPGEIEIVQREVERIDYSAFDLLLLGGDYTSQSTLTLASIAYLDAIFNLSLPTRLAALGNHDGPNIPFFTDVAGRPRFYTYKEHGITFVVLYTNDNGRNILGDELQMLTDTVSDLSDSTHLILIHHHLIWLSDYAPLSHFFGSPLIGGSSSRLTGLNFYDSVYPLLLQAKSQGVEVLCLAGDRTGLGSTEFFIDHTTDDGIHFLASGLQDKMLPSLRNVISLKHNVNKGTLTYEFKPLSDIPTINDEPLIINEVHYNPSSDQGDLLSFIELYNNGSSAYDVSEATFYGGIDFSFQANTSIAPGEYVLLAAEPTQFEGLGVRVFDYEGNPLPNSNEALWLRNSIGLEIDYVRYGTSTPWPASPDNGGPSLSLTDPCLDNEMATSWMASTQMGGTPGRANVAPPTSGVAATSSNITVSELHYRPPAPSTDEIAAGFTSRDSFEFIELLNRSTTDNVMLEGIRFDEGVSFTFDNGLPNQILAPGQRVVVVSNMDAFQKRYGCSQRLVSGIFTGSLSDTGEQIRLLGEDETLQEFAYINAAPWPTTDNESTFSLVVSNPHTNVDLSDPHSWRYSTTSNGTPGRDEWKPFTGTAQADVDSDGVPALVEYALGSSDTDASSLNLPRAQLESLEISGTEAKYIVFEHSKSLTSYPVKFTIETSTNLLEWREIQRDFSYLSTTNNGDSTATDRYRSSAPFSPDASRRLYRLRVSTTNQF